VDGAVRSLVDLTLTPEHRRGHGALYDGLNRGRLDVARLRWTLSALPLSRAAGRRIVLAVDVSPWLRPSLIPRSSTSCRPRTQPLWSVHLGQAGSRAGRSPVSGAHRLPERTGRRHRRP
jgi:hypothetical protein